MMQKLNTRPARLGIIAAIVILLTLASYELGVHASGPGANASPAPALPAATTPAIEAPGAVTPQAATPAPTATPAPPTPVVATQPATTATATLAPATATAPAQPATAATATPTPAPTGSGAVVREALDLRQGPGAAYPVRAVLPPGATVTVLGQDAGGAWLFVALADGRQGWLARSLTTYTATAPVVTAPPLPPTPAPRPTASLPSIQITAPASGSTFVAGQPVVVQSIAASAAGVAQVQLLADNSLVQTTNASSGQQILQASQSWAAATPGSHILTVIATDTLGNRSQPAGIAVDVVANATPLQVQILSPGQPTVIQAGQSVTVQSQAASGAGITRVELWADGQLYTATDSGVSGGISSFAVSQQWSSDATGEHSLFVRAFDTTGNSVDSSTITIGVADTNPPQLAVSISSSVVTVGQDVTVSTSATDSKGVTDIELWVDGSQVAVATSSSPVGQYTMSVVQSWRSDRPGRHTLYVVAHDSVGKSTQSGSVAVTVTPASTPTPARTPSPTRTPTPLPTSSPAPARTPAPSRTPKPDQTSPSV